MKIIICGAGQVGGQIARHLAREEGGNQVTVIDKDAGAGPADHRRLRRQRHRRLRLAPGHPGARRRARRRHGDRRDPVRRGQHGRLPGGAIDLLGAAQDRPPAGAGLPQRHLLRPLPPRPPADRRGDLAGVRRRRRGDAAAGRAGRLRHRGLPRRQGAARRHHPRRACAGARHAAAPALRALLDAARRGGRDSPRASGCSCPSRATSSTPTTRSTSSPPPRTCRGSWRSSASSTCRSSGC